MKPVETLETPAASTRATLRALAACALFAAAASLAAPSQAGTVDVRERTVNFSDLDTQKPAGTEALYRRLKAAAHQVCDLPGRRDIEERLAARACRQQALDRAVEQLAQPMLTALHRKGARALG